MTAARVLVAAAGRYGATSQIAEAVAWRLARAGMASREMDAEDVSSLDGWDAVVLGSAVHLGRWLEPARRIVRELGDALMLRPVWLFSSGPVEAHVAPGAARAFDPSELIAATGARDHVLLPGRIDHPGHAPAGRSVGAVDRPARDWDAIAAWAEAIGRELRGTPGG